MKPIDLLDALSFLAGHEVSATTREGFASFTVRTVRNLTPAERTYAGYDVLIQNQLDGLHGIAIPSARVRAVRILAPGVGRIYYEPGQSELFEFSEDTPGFDKPNLP